MKVVYQRVSRAAVTADGEFRGEIGKGAVLLVGVGKEDTAADAALLVKKCIDMRVFEDEGGRMNLSLADIGGDLVIVSNFTLYGSCRRGRRPDFFAAAAPDTANALYDCFVKEATAAAPGAVVTGVFGADMAIDIAADGPVTLLLDSEELKASRRKGESS